MEYNVSQSDYAYHEIRKRILSGLYNHEYWFTSNSFAEEFGMGITPVKKALNRLVMDGFLVSIPRRGYRLKHIFLKDVYDLMHVRMLIESGVAYDVARNAPRHPEILKRMEALIQLNNYIAGDPNAADTLDIVRTMEEEFHTLYINLTENQLLIKQYADLWSNSIQFYLYSIAQYSEYVRYPVLIKDGGFTSHEELYRLILKGDEEELKNAAANHLNGSIEILNSIMATKKDYGILI